MGRKHKYIGGLIGADPLVPYDEHWDDVTLLLNGEPATIADVSSASTTLAFGSSVSRNTNTSTVKYGSGSLRFDESAAGASGTYISYAGPNLGTGDFTVETWWRPDALPIGSYADDEQIWDTRENNSAHPLINYSGGTGNPEINLYADGNFRIRSSKSLTALTWHHIALVRSKGTYELFVDGESQGTYVTATAVSATDHYIGRKFSGTNFYSLNAHLDDFRFTPGVARYTAAFTPPTASFPTTSSPIRPGVSNLGALGGDSGDANWDDVVLLMDGTSTTTDLSATQTVTEIGTNTDLSNEADPFGNIVDVLDFKRVGTAISGIQVANSPIVFGSSPFTIEMWVKIDAIGSAQYLYSDRHATDTFVMLRVDDDGTLRFFRSVVGGVQGSFSGATALSPDTWHHVALTYDGSTLRMFLDGSEDATSNQSVTFNSSTNPVLGYDPSSTYSQSSYYSGQLVGQMAQVRVTKGVARDIAADWTAGVYNSPMPQGPLLTLTRPTRRWGGITGRSLVASSDEHWDAVTLLLNGSSLTDDLSDFSNDMTNTNATLASVTGPYNTTQNVLDFDNASTPVAYLTEATASGDFKFGTEDFTIEFWAKCDITNSNVVGVIDYQRGAGSTQADYFVVHLTNDTYSFWGLGGQLLSGAVNIVTNWNHIAITRQGTSGEMFINGTSISTSNSMPSNMTSGVARKLFVGRQDWSTAPTFRVYDGQLADLRITKGVARDIVPPTASLSKPKYALGVLSLAEMLQASYTPNP